MPISENGVSFFGSGGHSHNGVNSTIIDVGSYSLFDFSLGYTGSQSRINRQSVNQNAMEDWIVRVINSKVLQPSGLDLAPDTLNGKSIRANTITADQIAANTITANELSSNIVLVNNIIKSNNYVTNTTGWQISNNGNAEFISGRIGPFTISVDGLTNVGTVGQYSYTNYLGIQNYGDLTVYSNPNIGPHNGLYHKTAIVGEFISINRTNNSFSSGNTGAFIGYADNTDVPSASLYISSNEFSVIKSTGLIIGKPTYTTYYEDDRAYVNGNITSTANVIVSNDIYIGSNKTVSATSSFATSGSSTTARLTIDGIFTGYDSLTRPSSLRDLKENIVDIDDALSIISDLRPRKYNFKVDAFSPIDPLTGQPWTQEAREFATLDHKYGLIVEEVAENRPDLLSYMYIPEEGEEPNYLDFSKYKATMWEDADVLVLCIKAIQELSQKNQELEARLQALEGV